MPGTLPAVFDGGGQAPALAQFVADTLEVDDERVGGMADGDDQARDTGQREPVVLGPAQQGDRRVGEHAGHDQRGNGDQAQQAVLEEGEAATSPRPIRPAMRPMRSWSAPRVAEICCSIWISKLIGRAPYFSCSASARGALLGEGTGDLGRPSAITALVVGAEIDLAVQDDRELVLRAGLLGPGGSVTSVKRGRRRR